MSFRHKAIYGLTGTGKTWLLKRRAKALLKHKQRVLVYTGTGDTAFPQGARITTYPDQLEEWIADPKNYGSFIMMDEAAALYDEIGYNAGNHPEIRGLFMRGRHKGYTVYMATQYPNSIPRRNRINCMECYCFRLGDMKAAKQVHEDYGCPEIGGVPSYELILSAPKLHYVHYLPPDKFETGALG